MGRAPRSDSRRGESHQGQGQQFLDFAHPEDLEATAAVFQTMLNGARITDFDSRYRCRDGSYRVFSWRATFDPVTGDAKEETNLATVGERLVAIQGAAQRVAGLTR